jgi:hexokinase
MFDLWELLTTSLQSLVMIPSVIQALSPSLRSPKRIHNVVTAYDRTMDDFLREATRLFESPLNLKNMLAMSAELQEQFKQKLQSSNMCMLPSYNYTLPTGQERGSYLALDVGGSTFRVALVELSGRAPGKESMRIVKISNYRICNLVKELEGHQFFDWMADRIVETLNDPVVLEVHGTETLVMGLAWSFPIQYGVSFLWFLKSGG